MTRGAGYPPPDGDVVDRKSALGKEFFHLAVGQREAQVPANRQQDDLRFELPPLEKTRNRRREQEHRTSLSDHASKVATLPIVDQKWASLPRSLRFTCKANLQVNRRLLHLNRRSFEPLNWSQV